MEVDVRSTMSELEAEELAPGGCSNPDTYAKLLLCYLLENDLCSAKFLWKRLPESVKTARPDIADIWAIGQRLWQRDFPGFYASLNKNWPETLKPEIDQLETATRERVLLLLSHAYSSISIDRLAELTGTAKEDASELALKRGWSIDGVMVALRRPDRPPAEPLPCDDTLTRLTELVSFLEN